MKKSTSDTIAVALVLVAMAVLYFLAEMVPVAVGVLFFGLELTPTAWMALVGLASVASVVTMCRFFKTHPNAL